MSLTGKEKKESQKIGRRQARTKCKWIEKRKRDTKEKKEFARDVGRENGTVGGGDDEQRVGQPGRRTAGHDGWQGR